jgi:branched-chain amino acid transport system substrate-binding protein
MPSRRQSILAIALTLAVSTGAYAQKAYAPGVTDTEIKIGQTIPLSGPVSGFSSIGKAGAAYFKKVNDEGGVNKRKINLIQLDDAYQPQKALEQTRKLVEQDEVAFIFNSLGTAVNKATQRYLNGAKVPQVFVATANHEFGDPEKFPWTMAWQATNDLEGRIFARHILQTKPDAKIGVLYQNDDFGKGYLNGLRAALGDKASKMIVATASYEPSDATIDSQLTSLRAAGADTFLNIAVPKFAAQAIRFTADSGWKPLHFLAGVSSSVGLTLKPAGLDKATGIYSTQFYKDPTDPQWANDPEMIEFRNVMQKYNPGVDLSDANNMSGYIVAQLLVQVLKQCGDNLTRENIMKQAANLKDVRIPGLLPGITLSTSPSDFHPVKQMQVYRFDGARWAPAGPVIKG